MHRIGAISLASAALTLALTSASVSWWYWPPLGVPDDHVRAAELGQHRAGDLAGVRAAGVGRDVLRAVADQPLVPVDRGLHAADVGERRQHHHLDRR